MTADGEVVPDCDDEVVAGCWVTRDGRRARGDRRVSGIGLLTVFVLAVFVGFEVVSKVSTTLHTPLMSGANAIHGVILVGAILVTGQRGRRASRSRSAWSPIVLATINMVGGFVVTDRMLEMFKGRQPQGEQKQTWVDLAYLVAAVCFILALKGLSSPKTARSGNLIGAFGAVLAVRDHAGRARTCDHLPLILGAIVVGLGGRGARRRAGCR